MISFVQLSVQQQDVVLQERSGTAVTGVLLVLIKKKKTEEDEPMVDEKEEDLDLSGFTIS